MRVVSSADRQVRSATFAADGWTLGFDDQFGGDALDQTKWGYRQVGMLSPPGRTKSESSPEAVRVENGALKLGVAANPARPGYYLNGHVSTEMTYSFTYGVAAARVKFQKPRGMHGSFWLQSPVFGSVPGDAKTSGSEIDTVEYFGSTYPDGGLATFTYFKGKDGNSVKTGGLQTEISDAIAKKGDAWWKNYHVFSVDWSPEAYIFRIDGVETFRQTKNISGVPEVLLLSLLSSDWELPDLDTSQLPADMKVDWVRVWQQPPADARLRTAPARPADRSRVTRRESTRQKSRASISTLSTATAAPVAASGAGQAPGRTARHAGRPTPAPRRRRSCPRARRRPASARPWHG